MEHRETKVAFAALALQTTPTPTCGRSLPSSLFLFFVSSRFLSEFQFFCFVPPCGVAFGGAVTFDAIGFSFRYLHTVYDATVSTYNDGLYCI